MRTVEKENDEYIVKKGVHNLNIEALSDVGQVRKINEDSFAYFNSAIILALLVL